MNVDKNELSAICRKSIEEVARFLADLEKMNSDIETLTPEEVRKKYMDNEPWTYSGSSGKAIFEGSFEELASMLKLDVHMDEDSDYEDY